MNEPHDLGFEQFVGRWLRYVAAWHDQFVAAVSWQPDVFQGRPRDPWLGWTKSVGFSRIHWVGHPTRFLTLPAAQPART